MKGRVEGSLVVVGLLGGDYGRWSLGRPMRGMIDVLKDSCCKERTIVGKKRWNWKVVVVVVGVVIEW